jgi:type VI secretion system protein ImpH
MRTTFLGLLGVVSPLPVGMTEDVLAAELEDAPSVREFYDLFHHRVLSLFFRAWQKSRFHMAHRSDGADPFTSRALAFVGVDFRGVSPSTALPPLVRLGLAPLFARRAGTSAGMKRLAAGLLPGIPFEVECFVERRTTLRHDQRVRLGVQNSTLGRDMAIGRSVADRSGRFRAVLGPMTQEEADAISPGGALHARLRAVLDYAPPVLEAEVEIVLGESHVSCFKLGTSRLGRSTRFTPRDPVPLRSRHIVNADGTW